MEKSYYIPSIEEFHIGFEYEYKSDSHGFLDKTNGEWKKEKFSAGGNDVDGDEIYNIEKLIHENNLRVKHLDREDIESLGWRNVGGNEFKIDTVTGYYNITLLPENKIRISLKWHYYDQFVFSGTIQNKSELTRLMKQLNIKL